MVCIKPFSRQNRLGVWEDFPCGQCVVCKINRSREWAWRMVAESDYWPDSVFLTLTYSDESKISLDKADLQKFFKRLRKSGVKCSYYACGEYGATTYRPHYHVCLFFDGVLDFVPDASFGKSNGHLSAWPHGVTNVGTFSKESARYVSDYLLKSIDQDLPPFLVPPFRLASQSMGSRFFVDHRSSIVKHGFFQGGTSLPTPRYFKELFKLFEPDVIFRSRRFARVESARLVSLGRFPTFAKRVQTEINLLTKQGQRKEFRIE